MLSHEPWVGKWEWNIRMRIKKECGRQEVVASIFLRIWKRGQRMTDTSSLLWCFCLFVFATQCSMQELNSVTRDQTHAPCSGSSES